MKELSGVITNTFREKTVVVVGDLVADQFLKGTISRVSREAPVFILRHEETETLAGGAANAATNVASLGGRAVIVGLVGEDRSGEELLRKLEASGVDCSRVVPSKEYQTTTKVRVLAGQQHAARQQVIRIDYENRGETGSDVCRRLEEQLAEAAQSADAIIISDYDCGTVTPTIAGLAARLSREHRIPLLVDSRFRLRDFSGATTATPNQDEVEQILGPDFSEADCVRLCRELGYEALLITRGNDGMLLVEEGREPVRIEAVGSKEPVDVTGAGDTVIAVYALGLASGLSFREAASLANHAGGIVVMKKRTAAVSPSELLGSLAREAGAAAGTE